MNTNRMNGDWNGRKCSCSNRNCPYNGTKCFDNLDEPGIVQLPCIREKPSLVLCKNCCEFGHLNGTCAACRRDTSDGGQ